MVLGDLLSGRMFHRRCCAGLELRFVTTEAAELARLESLIESELAMARARGAEIPKEAEDVFHLGFVAAVQYVFRNAKGNPS